KPKSEQRINDGERLNRLFVVEIVPVLFVGEVEAGPYYPDLMHTVGCEQSPALELAKRRLARKVRQQGRVRRKAPGSVELGSFREFSGRITHQTRRLQNSGVGRLLRQNASQIRQEIVSSLLVTFGCPQVVALALKQMSCEQQSLDLARACRAHQVVRARP